MSLIRFKILTLLIIAITAVIGGRLFYLQVISGDYYKGVAQREHQGYTELPARRGEILITDKNSGTEYKLATNTTYNLLYADPYLIENPNLVAETLAPLLFDLEQEKELDQERVEEENDNALKIEDETAREEALSKIAYETDEELFEDFEQNLEDQLSEKIRDRILLMEEADILLQESLKNMNLNGVLITETGDVYAMPNEIDDKEKTAELLAEVFQVDADNLTKTLEGTNRYTVLKRKLNPEISEKIEEIKDADENNDFLGIDMIEEYYRYYPEGDLAAQLLGYTNTAGVGQYGIEGFFNTILTGKKGYFTSQIDGTGNQITVGDSSIQPAKDGANITLTIDRAIQLEVEKYLEQGVKDYQAQSGQAIVMDPETGAILAMANYPTFDPNSYSEVYELSEIELAEDQKQYIYNEGAEEEPEYYLYTHIDPDEKIRIFQDEDNPDRWYSYTNLQGPAVYKNNSVQAIYEPGSVFKPIAMSAAINAGEVEPDSVFQCLGPIEVDEYTIDNSTHTAHGVESMTDILVHSCNIGMSYVADLLGSSLFYSYIEAFGFGKRTDIQLDGEETGYVEYYEDWAKSELFTHAFGQGISVTPIQMITAMAALANDGVLMQPYLVEKVEYADGSVTEYEPEIIRQVVTFDTAEKIKSMLTAVIERGEGIQAKLEDHYIAGKTGTSQTYKYGEPLEGAGTTIGSFVGYGPLNDPSFIVLVKYDYPKTSMWGGSTAAATFALIADFLFDYYNIPPDKTN